MRRALRSFAILAIVVGTLGARASSAAEHGEVAVPEAGARMVPGGRPNPMHPAFAARDQSGERVTVPGQAMSAERTCGACHDAAYIASHHGDATAHASAP